MTGNNYPPAPEGWEFRLSPDRRLFAFYDPGNGPWFVPEPAMRGRFVDSADMDALGWYRYVLAEDAGSAAVHLALNAAADEIEADYPPESGYDRGRAWAVSELRRIARGKSDGLNSAERAMLRYALELAQERIWSEGGFTDADQAAVDSLKRLAGEETQGARDTGAPA